MSLPPCSWLLALLGLGARGEEATEVPPARVDLIFSGVRLHPLCSRAEHLHWHLARESLPGIARNVQLPVLDVQLRVARTREKLRVAESDGEFHGLQSPVA